MPNVSLTREEASERFEICGGCVENIGGICKKNNNSIRSFIFIENSGCPIDKWKEFKRGIDIAPTYVRNLGCCGK